MRLSAILLPLASAPIVIANHNAPIPRNAIPHQPARRLDLQDREVADLFKALGILQRAAPAAGDDNNSGLLSGLLGDSSVGLRPFLGWCSSPCN